LAGPNLPVNVDATYSDSGTDPSVQLHQQHHDLIHAILNRFDKDATPTNGQGFIYSTATGLYAPATPPPIASDLSNVPAGYTHTIIKPVSGVWPARPTARTDVIVRWRGADPGPTEVASGTGGMITGVDERLVTP
jgi:hypothetical protein